MIEHNETTLFESIESGLKLMATAKRGSPKWYRAMRCVIGGTENLHRRGKVDVAMMAWRRGIGEPAEPSPVTRAKPRPVRWSAERDQRAREMREGGATFSTIGRAFGFSKQRAAQICEAVTPNQDSLVTGTVTSGDQE